jgi:DNA polymerase-1
MGIIESFAMPKKQKTIVIFDAHAIIHRAYHALPSFSRSDGLPTGALYGLSAMLIRIIEELKPDYLVSAYDLPEPTFRHIAYESYKATRVKTDDDLKTQIEASREIFEAFGVPCLDAPGFEADDVVGTLVEKLKKEKNLSIIIASGDMDTLQLVSGKKVQVYTLKKGVTDTALYDEDGVRERYGFEPSQLIDYKGLRGDPSDNIIGVPGIGEKTATTIIQAFGSIEGLYEAIEKNPANGKKAGLTERIINILLEHKDDAFFSKTLATIRRDAPIEYALPMDTHTTTFNTEGLLSMLEQYEFRSLIPRVRKLFSIEQSAVAPSDDSVDPDLLLETSIALWVLYSEDTMPTLTTILARTKKATLPEANEFIIAELKKRNLLDLFEKMEKPLIPIIAAMTKRGIKIDRKHFESLKESMTKTLRRIESDVKKCTGAEVNMNSPKQLSELLFGTLGLKTKGKRKASGAFTTNAETLELLRDEHPVVPLVLEHREIQKLLATYVEALLVHAGRDDRVHAQFFQHGTVTGRFSSSNPNLQNLPIKGDHGKDIRKGFIATEGHVFIACDYSQIELRVLAILSGDEELIATFKRGEDIHASVASRMFDVPLKEVTQEMRRVAKVINFGILFGMGVTALAKNLGSDRAEAQKFYNNYFETFPAVARYLEQTKEDARSKGYTETLFGRRRYFPQINAGAPFLRAFAERMATNAPIQGTEADILKIAMLLIHDDLRDAGLSSKAHLLLQVHDELVYEVEEDVAGKVTDIIESAMRSAYERSPIKIPKPAVDLAVSTGTAKRLDELK